MELLQEDVRCVCAPDVHTPFASLQDAIDRLLPHHILGEEPGEEADLEETEDHSGRDLLLSRHAAWLEYTFRKTIQYVTEAQAVHERVMALRAAAAAPHRAAQEDDYLLAQWALEAEKDALARLRMEAAAREAATQAARDRRASPHLPHFGPPDPQTMAAATEARIREAQQAAARIAMGARAQAAGSPAPAPITHLSIPLTHHAGAATVSPTGSLPPHAPGDGAAHSLPHSMHHALHGAGGAGSSTVAPAAAVEPAEDPGGWSGWSGWTEAK